MGIDISSKMIEEAKYKYKDIDFIEVDIEQKNLFTEINRKFEYIIISDTIGYLIDIETTLEKLHKPIRYRQPLSQNLSKRMLQDCLLPIDTFFLCMSYTTY